MLSLLSLQLLTEQFSFSSSFLLPLVLYIHLPPIYYIVYPHSSFSFLFSFLALLLVCLCFVLKDLVIFSACLRNLETHYKNVNLQKEQKGRAELIIPRYHELVPRQEEKKASVCFFWWVFVSMWC